MRYFDAKEGHFPTFIYFSRVYIMATRMKRIMFMCINVGAEGAGTLCVYTHSHSV